MLKAKCVRLHEMDCNNKVNDDQGCGGRLEIMGSNGDKLPGVVISRVNNSLQCAAFGTHPNIQWSLNDKTISNDGNYTITEIWNQSPTTLYKSLLTFKSNIDKFLLRFGECDNQVNGKLKCTKEYMCADQYMFQNYFLPAKISSFVLSKIYEAPKNFSVLTQNATSVTFGWILNGKEYISKYRIECCQIRCAKIIFIDNISSTKAYATVHPLLPFTMYECKMKTFFSFASDMAVLLNSVVAVKTDTTVPSQPRELKAIIMSPSHVKLISKNSLHINGILKQYLVTLKGLKTYNSSFLHQKTIAINCTHFDIQNVYPGTTYFFNVKTENNAFVGPASNITTTVTPYDKPNAPPITVEKLGMQETVLTLNSASDETGPIRFYQLTIKKYWKLDCSYGLNNTTLMIETASTHVPLNVDIYKGVEDVTIAARNDLRAIGKATMVTSNTVSLKLSAGLS
ncbi:uncharacterized protein LOC130629669 isoform X2 [Hydractinia symbiolongicarpus]|uniref:uncharacterized protein LOC130629669 isoform X2 n=1 Tax=Hydractinia symbiolongicarpus TaxID=13093 RepID=UPI00254D6FE3|nr:uncharacterized protein LOC130629669 isoform X2 [Hydractinia symbiolongicarpus]